MADTRLAVVRVEAGAVTGSVVLSTEGDVDVDVRSDEVDVAVLTDTLEVEIA